MRIASFLLVGLTAFGLCACSATSSRDDDAPSAGKAGSASGGGSAGSGTGNAGIGSAGVGSGSAGVGGGSGGAAGSGSAGTACQQLERASSAVIADVLKSVDLSCASDDECEYASNSTDCHASCGALVGPGGKAALEAAIADENAGRCADFEDMDCVTLVPPCVPPPSGIRCASGRCTSDDEAPSGSGGSGSTDAGMPVDGCLDQTLTFGWNGGFVAFSDVITISPCATFAVERMVGRGGGSDASCANEIAGDAKITADAIDAALAKPAVQAAFASAPKLFGEDSRPVDGAVYSIELDGATIEVGGECGGGGGLGGPCTEIPTEVVELVNALKALVEQQMALPTCDKLP